MTMTAKVKPYKAGFGPFAPEVYRAPVPNPYRGITTDDAIAGLKQLFKADVDPATVACVVLEPVQGEGGFLPMPRDYLLRLQELCREHGILYVDDEVQSGRRPHRARCGRSSTTTGVAPDLLVSGKSIGGGLPLAAVTGPRRDHGRGSAGRSRRHVRRQPALVRRRDRGARRGRRARVPRSRRPRSARRCASRLDALAAKHDAIGDVRGLGPMLAFELAEQAPEQATAIVAAAFERGLLLLCVRDVRQRDPAAARR